MLKLIKVEDERMLFVLSENKKYRDVKEFNSEKEAKDFVSKNPDYIILDARVNTSPNKVYVVKKTNLGEEIYKKGIKI